MPIKPHGMLGRLFHKGALARWQDAAQAAGTTPLTDLRAQRYQARQLKGALIELCHKADDRLTPPYPGTRRFARPVGTDWSWRPTAWRLRLDQPGRAPVLDKTRIGDEISVFHDCTSQEITLRQMRNLRETDIAAFGMRLEVFHFTGSYLSVVIDLPTDICQNLQKQHLIQLTTQIEMENSVPVLVRLNVKHGPNTDQILLTLPVGDPEAVVEFDLSETQLNVKRAEKMWIDLMFQTPQMNQFTLRDLTISRLPRAQI